NADIAQQYTLTFIDDRVAHNGRLLIFETIDKDKSVVISVDGISSTKIPLGLTRSVNGLDIKNIDSTCSQFTQTGTTTLPASITSTTTLPTSITSTTTTESSDDDGGSPGTVNIEQWSTIEEDELTEYIPPDNVAATRVLFELNETEHDVKLKVKKSSLPSTIIKPEGVVYQYLIVELNVDPNKITRSEIEFHVENDWLDVNNINSNNIKLVKYINSIWKDIPIQKTGQKNVYTDYKASNTEGFSFFAIVGSTSPSAPINKCGNGILDSGEDCRTCPVDASCLDNQICDLGICRTPPPVPTNLCGNGAIDPGEDCRTCSVDVRCALNEYCSAGTCIPRETPKQEPTFEIKDYILYLVIGILIILGLIVAAIIYLRSSKKTGEYNLKQIKDKT
ncbi:MAG: PGF-pre-PGF domain-containing protein, partial [Nanoarchaeota archaeon]